MSSIENFIWAEKYRPKDIDGLMLPKRLKESLRQYLEDKEIPHFLFHGTAGNGKTTTAKVIIDTLGSQSLYINASDETGIDTIRTKVKGFVATKGFGKSVKIVILDEADAMSIQGQQSLKVIMEENSRLARFIIITNNFNKIIDPIVSRCTVISYNFTDKKEVNEMKKNYYNRLIDILEQEGVNTDKNTKQFLVNLITALFPDMRQIINKVQHLVREGDGEIDINAEIMSEKYDKIYELLMGLDILKLRKYVLDEFQLFELRTIYRELYKRFVKNFENKEQIPELIRIISQYIYQDGGAPDKELNLMGMLAEIIIELRGE